MSYKPAKTAKVMGAMYEDYAQSIETVAVRAKVDLLDTIKIVSQFRNEGMIEAIEGNGELTYRLTKPFDMGLIVLRPVAFGKAKVVKPQKFKTGSSAMIDGIPVNLAGMERVQFTRAARKMVKKGMEVSITILP